VGPSSTLATCTGLWTTGVIGAARLKPLVAIAARSRDAPKPLSQMLRVCLTRQQERHAAGVM
jgi:hypothetical protein